MMSYLLGNFVLRFNLFGPCLPMQHTKVNIIYRYYPFGYVCLSSNYQRSPIPLSLPLTDESPM